MHHSKPATARRKAELAWVRANPGPMTYGPPPGKLPDVRGLPEAARRINGAMLWMLGEEVSAPPTPSVSTERSTLRGLAASPGVYRGRVRVIRTTADLHRLRPGEVWVCPITTAAWLDGEEVAVDGNHGTVERVAPPPTSSGQHSDLSVN